ncbi:MAG: hypothetical protein IMW90_18110 [Thermogemmatispora sp.]|uniref:hypothetical protein n=1 Tax=Thermogemmatispora sp. TaxID=1968838 RepID=UPI0019EFDBB2|nr:hypothetical protein [Thermogemmatispora sp.]MBE3567634.1 hypothetical protein [Thermogemmatispora sp.]
MQDFDLRRKITAPPLPAALLHRKALLERLREAVLPAQSDAPHRQLILCCAPAGYGKTTLLADFARSTQLPCCWYFLERSDRDPVVFLRTLLASLRQTFPPLELHWIRFFARSCLRRARRRRRFTPRR